MNLFIPEIGTLIKIEEDWIFTLYAEYRNRSLFEKIDETNNIQKRNFKNDIVDLPKGLVVKVNRVYIRQGLSQFSSITFTVPKPKSKKDVKEMPQNVIYGGCKFWVKLHECNGLQFSIINRNVETSELFAKLYLEIERDAAIKYGVEKCTMMMASINKLMSPGQNINNLSTHLRYDQLLSSMVNRIKEDSFLSNHLSGLLKEEIRDYKLKQLI